ncbi:MAG: hypothetical protein KAG66_16420, partial [Methylococcales bacterium]|nr:hypothetical protein [Methylococcales bacterium]
MTLQYTNNAQSALAASITNTQTTNIKVAVGEGNRFPALTSGDGKWFPLTLIKADGSAYEIVK